MVDGPRGRSARSIGRRRAVKPGRSGDTNRRMTFSLSIAGVHNPPGSRVGGTRAVVGWAASLGFGAIQLDAAAPDARARDLGRSARRDLAATIRRRGLTLTGLDLWIPPEHYTAPATEDRAAGTLLAAIDLAAELGPLVGSSAGLCGGSRGLVVSVTLPDEPGAGLLDAIAAKADAGGILVEDFSTDESAGSGVIRPGFDSARYLLRGENPGKPFARSASALATVRLNDADDTGRRVLGRGRLDIEMMRALHATLTPTAPVITDLRGLADPAAGAAGALRVWGVPNA